MPARLTLSNDLLCSAALCKTSRGGSEVVEVVAVEQSGFVIVVFLPRPRSDKPISQVSKYSRLTSY